MTEFTFGILLGAIGGVAASFSLLIILDMIDARREGRQ